MPFQTLVKLVDAEVITKDTIRTHDLTLKVNNLANQLQLQKIEQPQVEQLMFTQ